MGVSAPLPQAGQVPQPNVSDLGRGINGVPMPANPALATSYPAPAPAPAPAINPYGPQAQNFYAALDNNKYIDAFNSSLGKERANLDQGLYQALGELGQRRDAAAQYVTQLPKQSNDAYGLATSLLKSGQNDAGLAPNLRAQAAAQYGPLQSAIAANKGATDSLAPFLNLANMANYQSGAAALRQQQMIGQNDLNSQQAQFQLEQMRMQAQRAQTQADQSALFAHEDKSEASKEAFQSGQAALDRKARTDELNTQAGSAPSTDPLYATTGLSKNEITAVKTSPEYVRFSEALASGKLNPLMVEGQLRGQGTQGQNLLAVLKAEKADYFKNKDLNRASGGGYMDTVLNHPELGTLIHPSRYHNLSSTF